MNKEIEEKIQKLFLAEAIIQKIKTKIEEIDWKAIKKLEGAVRKLT